MLLCILSAFFVTVVCVFVVLVAGRGRGLLYRNGLNLLPSEDSSLHPSASEFFAI